MTDKPGENEAPRKRSFCKLPLFLSLLLLLCSICLLAYIFLQYEEYKNTAELSQQEYNALLEREKELKALLSLDPCAAAQKHGPIAATGKQ